MPGFNFVEIISAFLVLFAIIDVTGSVPIFLNLIVPFCGRSNTQAFSGRSLVVCHCRSLGDSDYLHRNDFWRRNF